MIFIYRFLTLSLSFSLIGRVFSIENAFTIGALLKDFNSPLKLIIMPCWNIESTVTFIQHINHEYDFQIEIMKENNYNIPSILARNKEVLIFDIKCANTTRIFAKMNRFLFNFYKIIVFDTNINKSIAEMDSKMRQLFNDYPILPMSQIFYVCRGFSGTDIAIKQGETFVNDPILELMYMSKDHFLVYRRGLSELLDTEEFAWFDGVQLTRTSTLTSTIRRRNLQGFHLRASMVILHNDSLNHLDDYRDPHIDAISKLSYHLTNYLIAFVNATITYSIVPTWGYKNETTGKWNGMMGDLLRNESDIGATALFFTSERISFMEYISHPSELSLGFIFRAPKLSFTNNIYVLPFDRLLWMCIVILVIVLAVCLCGAVILELKVSRNSENEFRTDDVPIIIIGALCQQGAPMVPSSITAKFIMIIAFVILMFLYVSYSANILALLQSPSNQINTLKDLYESKLNMSLEDTVYNRYYFPRENETLRKNFYEKKLCNEDGKPKFDKLEDGIKKVRQGLSAYYTESSGAYKLISETFLEIEKCGLKEIRFFQMNVSPWYAIQKNSSYKEILKIGMMRLQEHGMRHRENTIFMLSKPKCLGGGGSFISASLTDTGPALLMLLWGFVVAFAFFIAELITANYTYIQYRLSTLQTKIVNKKSPNI